jgi:exonuclease VII small subunit
LRGRQVLALILLALLVVGSAIVAWRVPVPAKIPSVAWNSPWVFRGEVFLGFFVGAYVVLAICATTIVSGRPPKKLSFGLLVYEQAELEKAVEALSEGGTALQAVEAEVRGLQQGLNDGLRSSRAALEALIDAAAQTDVDGRLIERARTHLAALPELATPPADARREFDQAMARFDQILADLEKLRAERRGA